MARYSASIGVTDKTLVEHEVLTSPRMVADVVNASGFAAAKTAFEVALAVLVADAASPTQAHVTTADAAYTTLAAAMGAAPPTNSDVVLSFNATNVGTRTVLQRCVEQIMRAVQGHSALTP